MIITKSNLIINRNNNKENFFFHVTQSFAGSINDEQKTVRMASDSLVVKSYKEEIDTTATTTVSSTVKERKIEEYAVYQGVMGRPGIDFPVYTHIPHTSFSCRNVKKSGYYADLETDCQVRIKAIKVE